MDDYFRPNTNFPRHCTAHLVIGVILLSPFLSLPALASDSGEQSAPPITMERLYASPEFSEVTLSPDGNSLALVQAFKEGANNLVIMELETNKLTYVTQFDDVRIDWYYWKDNNTLLYGLVTTEGAPVIRGMFNVFDRRTGETRNLSGIRTWSMSRAVRTYWKWYSLKVLNLMTWDPERLLVTYESQGRVVDRSTGRIEGGMPNVYLMNLKTGKFKRVLKNPGDLSNFYADKSGRVRIASRFRPDGSGLYLHRWPDSETWEPLFEQRYAQPSIQPLLFTSNPDRLIVSSDLESDRRRLYVYNLRTRALEEELFSHEEVDVTHVHQFGIDNAMLVADYTDTRDRHTILDPELASELQDVSNTVPQYEFYVLDASDDLRRMLLLASNERTPGHFYLYNRDKPELERLFAFTDEIPEQALVHTTPVRITASDGLSLPAFISLPRPEIANGALILKVHGGPHGIRDQMRYDPEVQYLASLGYAVLQLNYRGSGGYGREFLQSGHGEWDGKIQQDLADAVDWASNERHFDGERVCIYGASFGGYSAMMSLARYPNRYRCGISYLGVSDLAALFDEAMENNAEDTLNFFRTVIGDPNNREMISSASPITRVKEIKAPILLAHGERDRKVPVEHSKRFEEKLIEHEKDHLAFYYPNEGHSLNYYRNIFHFTTTLEMFLADHLLSNVSDDSEKQSNTAIEQLARANNE